MSDIDEFAEQAEDDAASIQPKEQTILNPLYRSFTPNLIALLLTIIVMTGLITALFYQQSAQNNALVDYQVEPLTQQLNQIKALQKTEQLIAQMLLGANAENFVNLHAELISFNRQLLQHKSSNESLFQQWLNENKLAEDIVSRIQDSHARNQQLKQSSIIQLQLTLFSITPIIDKTLASQQSLQKQLQSEQNQSSFSKANAYAKLSHQLNYLQNLKILLVQILTSFEGLTMHTPLASFELLRLKVEQVFTQNKRLKADQSQKEIVDINQQIDTLEKILLTEQRALAKWQGYIRLAQEFQLGLTAQQQQISQLLLTPYKVNKAIETSIVQDILVKIGMQLSNKQITLVVIFALGFSLLFLLYSLWRLREKIKSSVLQSVEIIQRSLLMKEESVVVANCAETQAIIQQVQSIAKPAHNEQEFQELAEQLQSNQQLIKQKKEELDRLEKCNEQQRLDYKEQISAHLSNELQRYHYLENKALFLAQNQQADIFNQKLISQSNSVSVSTQLACFYQQLVQFHLSLEMKSEKSVLKLNDINLLDEIHAILFSKQQEQQLYDNQLFISCDEQLITQVKIDFSLFQQLLSLLIDITLQNCQASQLHLHLQLQDKRAGQQLVNFVIKVKKHAVDVLPSLITQLVGSQSTASASSPLVEIFTVLFAKQHGDNIVAQLTDDGYQLSFELPLAIASSAGSADKVILDNTKVMLLSNNVLLAEIIENNIRSAKGKFEKLARIDSFQQQITAKELKRHKLDLLVVASDMACSHLDLITEQINSLPHSLQPKLMILQTPMLSYERFGFYSQTEQILCKDIFLHNVQKLLVSSDINNQLLPCESFTKQQYSENKLPLLLAVNSPEQYQNLQRLLHWLGFQVQVVSHEAAQQSLWQTGLYSLLITEFAEKALVEMTSKPLVDVAVFSLTDVMPTAENDAHCEHWHFGKLSKENTFTELVEVLAPWLKAKPHVSATNEIESDNNALAQHTEYLDDSDDSDELVITQVPSVFVEDKDGAVFNFAQYLHHQGSAELALFMLNDYTRDNHQQLDTLIEAIKAKNIEEAQLTISALTLNAKILSAQELQSLCVKWSKLLSGSEIPTSLKIINSLLKETRLALNEIDDYAETI
jgi:hypothetical protein